MAWGLSLFAALVMRSSVHQERRDLLLRSAAL